MKSPLTEIIVDPICKKIFNNININGIKQLTFIFLLTSIYFIIHNKLQKSSILYLLYFLFFNCISSKNKDINIYMYYFIINLCYIIFTVRKHDVNSNIIILSIIMIVTYLISFSVRNYISSGNTLWSQYINKIGLSIYPNNDETKKYHIANFWKLFDSSLFSLFIFVLINTQKK